VARLAEGGITATVRDTRGRDIDAACGQLRAGAAPVPVRQVMPSPSIRAQLPDEDGHTGAGG
jgi:hypothetical protein